MKYMISQDEKWMRLAMDRARDGIRRGQTPFGACIVRGGKFVSCEHNVVWRTTDITAHAEIHAIRAACKTLKTIDLSGCVLYSTCEPCPMCFAAIHWARIDQVIYGSRIADAQQAGFNELTVSNRQMKRLGKSPVKIVGDFMREEAAGLFAKWMAKQRHKVY
ncbi:MAG: nucleoside deaminase [Candidatus Omnitrophica bacterium]|nr:nucleoside deaminase [Candidatus Omnitrophota bacterium]